MSRWTLWIEVLCAMMLSSAGGPSLAQPCSWTEELEWGNMAFKEQKGFLACLNNVKIVEYFVKIITELSGVFFYIIYPVQSFNLQILEKWSQKFDGMVGQDNGQNSKPLVSSEKETKIIHANESLVNVCTFK